MKKRIVCTTLVCMMIVLFSGCGGSGSSDNKSPDTSSEKPPVVSDIIQKSEVKYSLPETELFDNEYYKLTVNSIESTDIGAVIGDAIGDVIVNLTYENKTGDLQYISTKDCYINGYKIFVTDQINKKSENSDKLTYSEYSGGQILVPGKTTAHTQMILNTYEVPDFSAVEELTFSLRSGNSQDSFYFKAADTVTLYPTGLTADNVTYPERQKTANEQIIIDNDQILYVLYGVSGQNSGCVTVHGYLENKTDERLSFNWNNVTINDKSGSNMLFEIYTLEPKKRVNTSEMLIACLLDLPGDGSLTLEELTFNAHISVSGNENDIPVTWQARELY